MLDIAVSRTKLVASCDVLIKFRIKGNFSRLHKMMAIYSLACKAYAQSPRFLGEPGGHSAGLSFVVGHCHRL